MVEGAFDQKDLGHTAQLEGQWTASESIAHASIDGHFCWIGNPSIIDYRLPDWVSNKHPIVNFHFHLDFQLPINDRGKQTEV
jgi:hypothetical protein